MTGTKFYSIKWNIIFNVLLAIVAAYVIYRLLFKRRLDIATGEVKEEMRSTTRGSRRTPDTTGAPDPNTPRNPESPSANGN